MHGNGSDVLRVLVSSPRRGLRGGFDHMFLRAFSTGFQQIESGCPKYSSTLLTLFGAELAIMDRGKL